MRLPFPFDVGSACSAYDAHYCQPRADRVEAFLAMPVEHQQAYYPFIFDPFDLDSPQLVETVPESAPIPGRPRSDPEAPADPDDVDRDQLAEYFRRLDGVNPLLLAAVAQMMELWSKAMLDVRARPNAIDTMTR